MVCIRVAAFSQTPYWQQELHYTINVSLDNSHHSLSGNESIDYVNHSPDTLHFIWFHLWPNAYKNDKTAFSKQLSELSERGSASKTLTDKGYIDSLAFRIDGKPATIEPDAENIDI